MKTIYLAVAGSLVLTGCLNSSGDDSSTPTAAVQLTGILSDSAVKGVAYSSSSGITGNTGATGDFKYAAGDKVTFKIGTITLGSVDMASTALGSQSGNKVVRPKDLAGVTDETDVKALAVAQVIQTVAAASPSASMRASSPRRLPQRSIPWTRPRQYWRVPASHPRRWPTSTSICCRLPPR
jgi:hypothetical protein